ncbi:MAG: NADP-dependent oxidoreductase [Micrococcales bacterium]|nr:NADP-dependent oxidoreductase [Micrococcales bacterium]
MAKRGVAVTLGQYGGVEGLAFHGQVPRDPDDDEVLVEVVAAGVSHMDAFVRAGEFQDEIPLSFPAAQGSSFAGIVRKVGRNVKNLHPRSEVIGFDPAHGSWANHVTVPATALTRKPERLDFEIAGGLYLVGCTALQVVTPLGLAERDTVVVSAAAGGVGHIECKLARLAGAEVIGIAGAENADYLRSLGVKPVRYGDELAAAIDEAAHGRPVTAFIDNYGGYDDLAAELGVAPARFAPSSRRRRIEIDLYTDPGTDPRATQALADIAELLQTWGIRVLVSGFYAFDDLPRAVADLHALHSRGIVVVGMHPSDGGANARGPKLRSLYEERGR